MNKNKLNSPFKPVDHQHQDCLKSAVKAAQKHCEVAGCRLTPIRQRVLELVWENHKPVKAYDVLDKLKQEHAASAPPTVYRALDFLQEQGLVHKIESLNAYVGCGNPAEKHSGQFLLCIACGTVAELDDANIRELLEKKASQYGFTVCNEMVELKGVCQQCQGME